MKLTVIPNIGALALLLLLSSCQTENNNKASIRVNDTGEIFLFEQKVALEDVKNILIDSLVKKTNIPTKLDIQYDDEVLMGMRAEVETEVADAILAAQQQKQSPLVETLVFRKEKGSDCDQADTLRTNCATIDFQYPIVKTGNSTFQKTVNKWVQDFLIGILTAGDEEAIAQASNNLDKAARVFFDTHETFKGSVMYGAFEARSGSDIVLNDGKHLTLAIDAYSFQGGAHGNHAAAFATFDVQSAQQLKWSDLVTDKAALEAIVEEAFRKERADIFVDGFEFDDIFPFKLADNYGLTQNGIYIHYLPYEVAPYAMGPTTFLLPFSSIEHILKH